MNITKQEQRQYVDSPYKNLETNEKLKKARVVAIDLETILEPLNQQC